MDKIINILTNKIIDYLVLNNYIRDDKRSVYSYSAMIAIQSVINIIATLIIGFLFGAFFENLCFFIVFKILRKYSGGLHSSKFSSCLLISIITNIIFMIVIKYLEVNPHYILMMVLEIASFIVVLLFAPVKNVNKQISEKEHKLYKLIVSVIIVVLILFSIVLIVNNCLFISSVGMSIVLNSLLIIAEKVKFINSNKANNRFIKTHN